MIDRAAELRAHLHLQPHPEGGHYREIHRSAITLTQADGRPRAALTSIHFLLAAGEHSTFHVVRAADEAWCLLEGGPLELHILLPTGGYARHWLGRDIASGERHQAIVPAGAWQAATLPPGVLYALCACIVAPGFEFDDFAIARRADLLRAYPAQHEIITRLARD